MEALDWQSNTSPHSNIIVYMLMLAVDRINVPREKAHGILDKVWLSHSVVLSTTTFLLGSSALG